jgi:glutathione S-transferase
MFNNSISHCASLNSISTESEALWTDDDAKKLKAKNNILDKLAPAYYTQIEKDLKENGGKYLVGKNFTWADFLIAHFNEVFESFVDQTLLDNYPTIKLHQQNVFNVPQIKAWMAKRPVTEA